MTIILFVTRSSDPLTDSLAGHRAFETLAISEVFALVEEHPGAQIIMTADIEDERAKAIQQRYPTMRLKENATLKDISWALEMLFPRGSSIH